jgi:D-alanyl-D-alanine endopeptidase (penicillin-binding protein 7)
MKRILLTIIVCLLVQTIGAGRVSAAESDNQAYLKYFYNRYSKQFDKIGLKYAAPDYGVKNFRAPKSGREIISLVGYYKYRAMAGEKKPRQILHDSVLKSIKEISSRPNKTLSFNDAEALFLAVRLAEEVPDLLIQQEIADLLKTVKNSLAAGIAVADTENRALIAGAHWQYLNNYLLEKSLITAEEKFVNDAAIKEKIVAAVKSSISPAGWYREGGEVVPHYQAVSAFMLLAYGQLTNQKEYLDLAERLYLNLKKITFSNGLVEAQAGPRPVGEGAQFYLMMGALGGAAGDIDAAVYFNYAAGNRFFSDARYPNRLEYHRTSVEYKKQTYKVRVRKKLVARTRWVALPAPASYHDDYAFVDAAELGLAALPTVIPANAEIQSGSPLKAGMTISFPLNYTDDGELQVQNDGVAIKIYDLFKKQLVSLEFKSGKVHIKPEVGAPLKAPLTGVNLAPDEFVGAKITTAVGSYVITDAAGAVVAGKNLTRPLPLASLTKMTAALVFVEHRNKDWAEKIIYDSKKHFVYGNYLRLKDGGALTVKDLFYSLLVGSVNEPAEMLVEATNLSRVDFIAAMNQKARALGLTATHYVEPSGFSTENITTAADQLKVLTAVFNNSEIRQALSMAQYEFEMVDSRGKTISHKFNHTNSLLREKTSFNILASKTGYLDEAQKCLAMVIEIGGRQYYFVSLGDPSFSKDNTNPKILISQLAAPKNLVVDGSQ